ncbi:hypothetical protein [Bradyrhizobium sp. LA7.1]|uniref:hypothetical protein n=1 Tax=Bradyrhizobium sp. LA7.1 TaxID=3156324 RepID=UPI0033917AB7
MESSSEAAVRAQARREIEIQELNAKFAAVDTAGSKEFGDRWDGAKHDLSMLDDGAKIPKEILQVALETDEPARVLFELSKDLELADQLLEMPPIKRAIAMDRIALQAPANRPQSKMSTQGDYENGGDDRPSDRDSDEEWNRKEEARERRMREQRRQGMR